MHVLVSNSFLSTLWTQFLAIPETDWRLVKLCTFQFLIFWCQISELFVIRKLIDDHKEMSVKIMPISAETHWRSRKNISRKCAHFLSLQQSFLRSLNSQFVVIPETLWRQEKNVCKTMHVSQFIVILETNED